MTSAGPWTFDVSDEDVPREAYVRDAAGRVIATLRAADGSTKASDAMLADAQVLGASLALRDALAHVLNAEAADALELARGGDRLIAAAPDLLRACQQALRELRCLTSADMTYGAWMHSMGTLDHAIAKATTPGGSSPRGDLHPRDVQEYSL